MKMMNQDSCFLTFAIPTKNRALELTECIESILRNLNDVEETIEIVISDNGSTDSTRNVVEQYQSKYKLIKYLRFESNLGFEINLFNSIENSSGRYIWVFSDDDILTEGALYHITELIKIHSPTYILTNYNQFTAIDGNKVFPTQDLVVRNFDKTVKTTLSNLDFVDIVKIMTSTMGFLPINIFKADCIDWKTAMDKLEFIKAWPHLFLFAQATRDGGGCITPYKCVSQRTGNSRVRISVFFKYLPATFSFIFNEFELDKATRYTIFKSLRDEMTSIRALIYLTATLKLYGEEIDEKNQIDGTFISFRTRIYFRIIFPLIPRRFVLLAIKIVRMMKGKGFTLGQEVKEYSS